MTFSLRVKIAAATASGLLLALAFPPLDWYGSAWFGLIPLLLILTTMKPGEGFKYGLLSGLVFWGTSLWWLLTLGRTGAPWALAIPAWLLLSLYCALYHGIFGAIVAAWFSRCGTDSWRRNIGFVMVAPLIWAGLEFIRTVLFTGFPWNSLGVSQYLNPLICQMAEFGGVYIVSAFLVMMNAALLMTGLKFKGVTVIGKYRTHPELTAALIVIAVVISNGIKMLQKERPSIPPLEITALQPNVPQTKKWPIEWGWMVMEKLERGTKLATGPYVDMIVWPETAMPSYALTEPVCRKLIDDLMSNGIPILVGSMDERVGSDYAPQYFNSSMLFESTNGMPEIYDKNHLVPCGEYIPFTGVIPALKHLAPLGWICAEGEELKVFSLKARPDMKFSSLICFEDIFPYLSRECVRLGARLIVNQTNDAWFDDSAGLRQHMAHCVFRCVENRVPMVRVTNTGITCLIDRNGRIVRNTLECQFVGSDGTVYPDALDAVLKEGHLAATVLMPPEDMEPTFYTKYGDVFAIPCAGIALGALLIIVASGVRKRSPRSC